MKKCLNTTKLEFMKFFPCITGRDTLDTRGVSRPIWMICSPSSWQENQKEAFPPLPILLTKIVRRCYVSLLSVEHYKRKTEPSGLKWPTNLSRQCSSLQQDVRKFTVQIKTSSLHLPTCSSLSNPLSSSCNTKVSPTEKETNSSLLPTNTTSNHPVSVSILQPLVEEVILKLFKIPLAPKESAKK